MPQPVPNFLSAADIAPRLGCSSRTVRRLMASGVLPSAPRLTKRHRYGVEASVLRARLDELIKTKSSNDSDDDGDSDDGDDLD